MMMIIIVLQRIKERARLHTQRQRGWREGKDLEVLFYTDLAAKGYNHGEGVGPVSKCLPL